jgi:Protein of unknown function (DUF1492).
MRAKEYLSEIKRVEEKIRNKKNRLKKFETQCEGVGAIRYDKDKVQSSPRNLQEELLVKYIDLQREINEEIFKLEKRKIEILREIDTLSNSLDAAILCMRFVEGMSWKEVAKKLNYDCNYVKHRVKRAYEAFETEILEDKNGTDTERGNGENSGEGNKGDTEP